MLSQEKNQKAHLKKVALQLFTAMVINRPADTYQNDTRDLAKRAFNYAEIFIEVEAKH